MSADLTARSAVMPDSNTYERRSLERALRALEAQVEFVEEKLVAVRAGERGDYSHEAARTRAIALQTAVLGGERGYGEHGMHGGGGIMALDTYVLIAAEYALQEDALADYDAVRSAYVDLEIIDTYDAAVISKDLDGKVQIVKRVEEPTRQSAAAGLVVGLAVGALVALFPAVAIGAGLAVGGAAGAAIGATAGHVAAGMSRSDLKDLGELLDSGTSGLVVVAAADVADRVEASIERGKDIMKKQVQLDADGLKTEIDEL